MRVHFLFAVLLTLVGFWAGTALYGRIFDPDEFLAVANQQAKFAYLSGCLEAKTGLNGEPPFAYEKRYCHYKAEELFQKLETLRKQ